MAAAFGDFVFDPVRRELRKGGSLLKVDAKQLDLLACFLRHPDEVLTKQELLDEVWEGRAVADSALSVAVAKLRKVLDDQPSEPGFIENRYGRGYRFLAPVTQLAAAAGTAQLASAQASAAAPVSSDIFVGRADGMARLEAAFARLRKGEGSINALIGEPGIGKTRLADAAEQSARRTGARTAWGRFQPSSGAPPLWAFAQVLRELDSGGLADELLSTMRDQPAAALERAGEPASQDGAPLWGLTSESLQLAVNTSHHALDRIAQALLALARETPLVILLDDLQWADAASLRLLSYVASDIARWPIAIVATQRSGEHLDGRQHGPELLRLLTHRNCERIELRRLDEHDVAEYCGALFGTPTAALCRAVFTRSEGNPFFMVELLRPWSGISTCPMPEQLGLSEFALDPMRQRLRSLPAVSRQVLSAAAVIGHDFDLGLLSQVTQRGPDELLEALDGSLANDTVVPSNEMVGGYSFDHELIRELLYNELAVSERARLHLRTGESLLLRRAAGHEIASAELARHFIAALPQGDVTVAIEHARAGAAAAYRLGSVADARVLLRGALEALQLVVSAPVETRTVLLIELAMVERMSGDSNYHAHLTQGVALAREHRFGALLALAGTLLAPAPGLMVDAQACEVLEAALDVLPPSDAKRRAILLAHLAWTPPHSRSARKVAALLDEATQLAERADDRDARYAVRGARIYFSGGPATQAESAALTDELQRDLPAHAGGLGSRGRRVGLLTTRIITAMQRGERAAVERLDAMRVAELAKLNNVEVEWHHRRFLAVQRMNRGEFAGLDVELQQLRAQGKRLGLQAWRELSALDYGTLLVWTKGGGEFAALVRTGNVLHANDSPQILGHKLRAMIDFGLLDDARAGLATISLEALADLPSDRDSLVVLAHLAEASVATASLAHCAALYELLAPFPRFYAVGISFHCYGSVSNLLGLLARALGREQRAIAHFEEAEQLHAAMGLRGWLARSQVELARMLLASNERRDHARAQVLLDESLRTALSAGMAPLAQAIQELRTSETDSG